MSMDIISGIVVVTSVLILGLALTGVLATRSGVERSPEAPQRETTVGMRGIQGTLVLVYFVATTHLLLIAQQLSLALGNFLVGLILMVVLFVEPAVRGARQSHGEDDTWRR